MAVNKWFYLDEAGLSQYDGLIKQYIDDADALSIKYLTFEPSGSSGANPTTIRFWKVDPTASGATAAYTVTLPDATTLMTKVTSGTTGNLVKLDANGQVVDANVAASDLLTSLGSGTANAIIISDASGGISRSSVIITDIIKKSTDSGATFTAGQWAVFDSSGNVKGLTATAANVAFDDTTAQTGGNTVQAAIESIAQATGGGVAAKTVYITETAGSSSDPYSKRYGIYQGANGSSSSPVPAEKLGDIDIPKDMVVEDGSVVEIFFDDSDDTLHEGSISGPDVTTAIVGSGTATAADAGKYIKLVIANSSSTALYIKATDLVDIYTGGTTNDGTISISNSNVITFDLSQSVHGSLALADTSLQPVTSATADNIVTFTSAGGIQDSGVSINDVATGIEDIIAPAFSDQSTYALGDYVIYDGKLYECTTAVTVAGPWVAANWTESKVMTSFQPIPSSYINGLFGIT
jgi:hypothetical protein